MEGPTGGSGQPRRRWTSTSRIAHGHVYYREWLIRPGDVVRSVERLGKDAVPTGGDLRLHAAVAGERALVRVVRRGRRAAGQSARPQGPPRTWDPQRERLAVASGSSPPGRRDPSTHTDASDAAGAGAYVGAPLRLRYSSYRTRAGALVAGDQQLQSDPAASRGVRPPPRSTLFTANGVERGGGGAEGYAAQRGRSARATGTQGFGNSEDGPFINKPDETSAFRSDNDTWNWGNFHHSSGATFSRGELRHRQARGPTTRPQPADRLGGHVRLTPLRRSTPAGPGRRSSSTPTPLWPHHPLHRSSRPPLDHRGFAFPRDHLLLDLFWMPVVEPYAISEPFSTGGKVNMNYEIMPFRYIKRRTALHAVIVDDLEMMARLPAVCPALPRLALSDGVVEARAGLRPPRPSHRGELRYEVNMDHDRGHPPRFRATASHDGDIFRSASEICEIFLIPKPLDPLASRTSALSHLGGPVRRPRPGRPTHNDEMD